MSKSAGANQSTALPTRINVSQQQDTLLTRKSLLADEVKPDQPVTASIPASTAALPTQSIPQPQEAPLRLALASLTSSLLLIAESTLHDGVGEQQLLNNMLQAITKHQARAHPPSLRYFQWPPAAQSPLLTGKFADAFAGLLHHARAQGISHIVILNHQLHKRLLTAEQTLNLHTPLAHSDGFQLLFSHSLHAMHQQPAYKKQFWDYLKPWLT